MAGGGSKTPTEQTITQTSIPSWAEPYATKMLGQAEALTDLNQNPYQAYSGQRVADFSGLQNQAFGGLQNMQPDGSTQQAGQIAGIASLQGLNNNYNAPQFNGIATGYQQTQAPSLSNYQMSGPGNVRTQNFGQMAADQYMSPYMNNVLESQKKNAVMDYARALPQLGAAATQVGGLGGTRSALMQSEANRNLQSQLQDIDATGMQSAYSSAQQQFNADQARRLQAQQGNQNVGYQTGAQNLASMLSTQQLGANQSLQSQQGNQQAGLTAQQQALNQNQAMNQFNLTNANQQSQAGLQGLNMALQGANTMGNMGNQSFQQQMGINNAQLSAGQQQQQNQQQNLNALYQQFLDQQNYPYKQMGFMSDVLHGLPSGDSSSTVYGGNGNSLGQAVGLAGGLGSLFMGGG